MNQSQPPSRLEATSTSKRLIVNDKPFLMLAAELQNSSMSSSSFMKPIWPTLVADNVNTVLGSVYWEQIEPEHGNFDFSELKQCILDARAAGLRLVLLWFGSFKNGLSTYVPQWIKTDQKRFPRVQLQTTNTDGRRSTADILSLFDTQLQTVEKSTFMRLMQFIKEIDATHGTVIMVQVENEVGVLGDSRDRSDGAEKAFTTPVPQDLRDFLVSDWEQLHATLKANLAPSHDRLATMSEGQDWKTCFGESSRTDELFMAYHYSRHLEALASVGKKEYDIPLYTNVWQNYGAEDRDTSLPAIVGGGSDPGIYPSGGGVINVLDIWQRFAPSLDFIAPDIYLNDYASSCSKYRHRGQPLFIPEQRRDEYGARRIWEAYGSYQALGTSPFGIDTTHVEHGHNPFAKHYALLSECSHHILEAQKTPGSCVGFFFDDLPTGGIEATPDPCIEQKTFLFGDWRLIVERSFVFGRPAAGYGMIIQLEPSVPKFLLIGRGFQVIFESTNPTAVFSGILSFKEKKVVDRSTGEMETIRWLNGDETRSGKFAIMPSEDPDYGGFPISVTVPAGTGIAEVEAYALYDF